MTTLLLAEELVLLTIDPAKGRPRLGERSLVNAALAGLLLAELALGTAPDPLLAAAQRVLDDRGPKLKPVLSDMDRALQRDLGTGTWDSVTARLVERGVLGPATGSLVRHHELLEPDVRESVLLRMRAAAAGDGQLDARTAVLLSMTGPAHLLELVAPERSTRRHARQRIDHCLDYSELSDVGDVVRKVLQEAATAAAAGAAVMAVASVS